MPQYNVKIHLSKTLSGSFVVPVHAEDESTAQDVAVSELVNELNLRDLTCEQTTIYVTDTTCEELEDDCEDDDPWGYSDDGDDEPLVYTPYSFYIATSYTPYPVPAPPTVLYTPYTW